MAQTRFSGPVVSDNGFSGTVLSGSANITVLTSASATVTNLLATTLTIGTTKITSGNALSGTVSIQLGRIPVLVGSTTAYIALYSSLVP
jgi:hypothetical protein